MTGYVPVPAKGDGLRATWGAAVANGINALAAMAPAGMLVREGVGCGTEALPRNARDRRQSDTVHPWKVYAQAQSEDVDHCFEVYVPATALTIGKKALAIEGLTAVEGAEDRYTLDDESEIGDATNVFVAVVRTEDDDGEAEISARIAIGSDIPEANDDETIISVFPVAKVSVDSSGDHPVGKVERQFARSVVALATGHEPDEISTATVTADDADDPNAIQIKDFDNDESDSEQGLTQRIEVVKDGDGEDATYHLEAKKHKGDVFLLARVNGQIRYIPLTGTAEEEEEEEVPETPTTDPCEHPGGSGDGGGGVVAEEPTNGGGASDDGGVAAEGDAHPGNPCTDC